MGNQNSGRKRKDTNTRQVQQSLTESAVYAVKLIRDTLRGTDAKGHRVKSISGTKAKLCELAISHAIGLPRQKVDLRLGVDILTLRDLAQLAEEGETKQLPVSQELLEQPAENIIEGETVAVSNKHSNQPDDTH